MAMNTALAGPLAGIRVLDLSAYIAGPYGCALLADLGAEVIKIEPPAGDNLRKYPSTLASESRAFLGVNRSKRGMVLDLKDPQDLQRLLALVDGADVLVHNFRPSVPARLGIAWEQLRERNPRLIYCAVTGYGEQGPLKDKAGYDQVLQTMTGMCALQGPAEGPPQIVYGSVVDYYAASLVAGGVSAALYEREKSGRGQEIGVSLLRSALAMQSARMVWAEGEPREVGRDMRSGGITGIHPTRDGFLYISANTGHFWQALCEKTGLQDLLVERYDSVRKRAQHQQEIVPRLHAALAQRSALEWEAHFGEEVPCAAARTIEDMFDFPQVQAEEMVTDFTHPVVGRYRGFTRAWVFGRTPGPQPFAAPALDEHGDELRAEADRHKR
ncbi:MAG TPA: CoA transferase [Ramlibacter sp.]|jgi:crotonobetainyl-CoA:carnitine CoA-transferase CaiB-like acyl-CoA transferase|nr:CoA transferase [Ramlibacter sp.]